MADLKEKLVELIASKECDYYSGVYEEWVEHDCEKCGARCAGNCAVTMLADHLIANGVTVQEWIPVTERLPEKGEEVLAYTITHDVRKSHFRGEKSWYGHDGIWRVVTHWMPLPEAPKGV